MKNLIILIIGIFLLLATNAFADCPGGVCYVRTDGGTSTQCTGGTDAAYPGSGTGQSCALKHLYYATGWYSTESGGVYSGGAAGIMAAGDDVIIKPGSYKTGYDAQFTNCSTFSSAQCIGRKPPSGTSGNHTRIFGCSLTGCTGAKNTYPELWGTGRVYRILDLTGQNYVEVGWLNITDHATCDAGSDRWNCGSATVNTANGWDGIEITGASNITLRYMWVHGMTRYGLQGTCSNCSILGSSHFDFNYAGYNQDTCNNAGTCGSSDGTYFYMFGNNPTDLASMDWNGCVEDPNNNGTPMASGCQNGNNGGYGDGLGASDTAGTWFFDYVSMSHNTSDGLDLKYHTLGTDLITIRNSIFVNNAGNQIKTANNAIIYNNIIEGNCNYLNGSTYRNADGSGMSLCNSSGDLWGANFAGTPRTQRFYGNTVVNDKGNVFVVVSPHNGSCGSGDVIDIKNNVIQYTGYYANGSSHDFSYIDTCSGSTLSVSNDNNINGFSNNISSVTGTPALSGTFDSRFTVATNLSSSSPARNIADETAAGQPSTDINGFSRGAAWDSGAVEYGSTYSLGTCGNNTRQGSEVCDGTDLVDSNGVTQTCVTQGYASGTLACSSDCLSYSYASCVTSQCGNSTIEGNEQCDTANLNGQTCASLGYSSCTGTPSCSSCSLTQGTCVAKTCGNSCVDSGEACDDGNLVNGDGCSSRCEYEVSPYEKFLTYTDGDSASYIDTHTNSLIYSGITRNNNAYLRYDYGASHFGDFTHRFSVRVDVCTDNGNVGAIGGIWAMSSGARTGLKDQLNNTDGAGLYLYCLSHSSSYQWTLFGNGTLTGAQTLNDSIPVITRYVEVNRSGSTLTAKFYSDPNYTTQVGSTLTISDGTAYRYFYPVASLNNATSGTSISGENSNYNLSYGTSSGTSTGVSVQSGGSHGYGGCEVK